MLFIRSAYKIEDEYLTTLLLDKAVLLPFWNPIAGGFDENGQPVMRPATLDDTLYLAMYAGTEPVEL